MYSYKINNSYTVYVNWALYNEAKQISKKYKSRKGTPLQTKSKKADVIIPLQIGACVSSKKYGNGILKSKESNGVLAIQFHEKIVKFMYPLAFQIGSLATI